MSRATCVIHSAECAAKVKDILGEDATTFIRGDIAYTVADVKGDTEKLGALECVKSVRVIE